MAPAGRQDRAVLGDVDVLPGEHGLDPARQVDLTRESDEKRERLVGQEVLRQVDVQVTDRAREA